MSLYQLFDGAGNVIHSEPMPAEMHDVITPIQGRLALKRAGLLEVVESAIVQANGETQIWWEYATLWHRDHSLLNALAESLGLTSKQVDELFVVAGAIE